MLTTAGFSLLALFASLLLAASGQGTWPAVIHLAFAAGILPLILAAMIHFVPVLTRSGDPQRGVSRLPHVAQVIGLLVPAALQGWLPYWGLQLAACLDLLIILRLLYWIRQRSRAALGTPHPGWRWYAAALLCAALALLAILAQALWPTQWLALRNFHLHLNTLGLVGLAALGTLPVLLSTALGQFDPEAASWLRRRLGLTGAGAFLVGLGSAWGWPWAVPGAALLLVVVLSLAGHWGRRFGWRVLLADGVAVSLVSALLGLALALTGGVLHAARLWQAWAGLGLWAAAFLLPLVTGALAQLLPVWRWPGPQIPARPRMRGVLAAGGHWRAALFLAGGMALFFGLSPVAAALIALGAARFAFDLFKAMRLQRSTR